VSPFIDLEDWSLGKSETKKEGERRKRAEHRVAWSATLAIPARGALHLLPFDPHPLAKFAAGPPEAEPA
jgi:hypothetical protein